MLTALPGGQGRGEGMGGLRGGGGGLAAPRYLQREVEAGHLSARRFL